jgi:integrase/recombinase XerD
MNTALAVREDTLTQAAITLELEAISPETRKAYTSDVLCFRRWLLSQDIDNTSQITRDVMLQYRGYLLDTWKKATAARRFVVARRLLEAAVTDGLLPSNPAEKIKFSHANSASKPHEALTERECYRLLDAVDTSTVMGKRDYALLMVLIKAGLRRAELIAATLGDISFKQEEHIVLTVVEGKGDKYREIPLEEETFHIVNSYLEAANRLNASPDSPLFVGFRRGDHPTEQPLTDEQVCYIVKQYAKLAGVKATPHDLRASAITFWIETGANIVDVQRLAGHANPGTTSGYYSRKQHLKNSPVYKVRLKMPEKGVA